MASLALCYEYSQLDKAEEVVAKYGNDSEVIVKDESLSHKHTF